MSEETNNPETEKSPRLQDGKGSSVQRLVRLREQVEGLRTDPTKIPAFEPMGWDEACAQILALIDEANRKDQS